ncbi:MAG: 1-(5-phosphoribosyl)-5-[(5-phosphoribosylamino)methylideneamino]imidazole-4-carboxamide isomerase [Fimbriimonas sp.]
MLILPAIDIRGGQCVRLLHGDYAAETVYSLDPAEVALGFEQEGAEWIHVVDLDGAKSGVSENLDVIRQIVRTVSVPIEVGGGVRTLEQARVLLDVGVTRVVLGTALARDPQGAGAILRELGERAVAGIDARGGKAAVAGWTEDSGMDAVEMALRLQEQGCRRLIVTDIARDGALTGPNLEFLQSFLSVVEIPIIASGGVSELADLIALQALEPKVEGAIVGRAIYENRFTVSDAIARLSASKDLEPLEPVV